MLLSAFQNTTVINRIYISSFWPATALGKFSLNICQWHSLDLEKFVVMAKRKLSIETGCIFVKVTYFGDPTIRPDLLLSKSFCGTSSKVLLLPLEPLRDTSQHLHANKRLTVKHCPSVQHQSETSLQPLSWPNLYSCHPQANISTSTVTMYLSSINCKFTFPAVCQRMNPWITPVFLQWRPQDNLHILYLILIIFSLFITNIF